MTLDDLDQSLDRRIASAFRNDITSTDLAALIREVEAASAAANEAAERAKTRALNPALSAQKVSEARQISGEAQFRKERLATAVSELRARLQDVRHAEKNTERQQRYDNARIERNDLVRELNDLGYQDFAEKLADLLGRIAALDVVLLDINRDLPDGARTLLGVEQQTRGVPPGSDDTLVKMLRMPTWSYQPNQYAWPPTRANIFEPIHQAAARARRA